MEIRIFQLAVPLVFIFYFVYEVRKILNGKKSWIDLAPNILISVIIIIVAIAPDWTTNNLANLLGIKSNVNAILFSLIGILCLLVFRIFDYIRELQSQITKLSMEYALLEEKITSKE